MRRVFVFDQEKCMGCNACTVACKDNNDVNPGPIRWRYQQTYEPQSGGFFPFSISCAHCEDPACLRVCGARVITKRPDGIVHVDRTKCRDLKTCLAACPFAAAHIADDQQEPRKGMGWMVDHPMQKCDFCKDRQDRGEAPICVRACPCFALDSGDYDEMIAKYKWLGIDLVPLTPEDFPYVYKNNTNDTKPSILVNKRKSQTIIKAIDPY
jgi:anaerobic dimethyl sulfoxide reductase subunit B (iron-sulfur subunit)